LAYFLRRLSLDLVGVARAAKGDVTPIAEKLYEIPLHRSALLRASPLSKVRTDPFFSFFFPYTAGTLLD